VWISIEDACNNGVGQIEGRLWGRLRLFRESNAGLDIGETMRYLAEIAWVPHAILGNAALSWKSISARRVEVSTQLSERNVSVLLDFDDAGDIVGARAASRPRMTKQGWFLHPWYGTFSDYRNLGAVRIPTRGKAYWDLPEGELEYWRGEVTGAELQPSPGPPETRSE
jgi:hypothetical protein